jgi:dTMP kinase
MKKGVFIVLEGPDRSGKSTQAALLKDWLERDMRRRVRLTREPGGTAVSEKIREILLAPDGRIEPMTELFLYETSRMQHTLEVIKPALEAGQVVLCDRYTMSTTAYQGYGRGLPLEAVETLNRIATEGLEPDLTVVFDVPARAFRERERAAEKAGGADRLEREPAAFRAKVRAAYARLARRPGVRRVDAGRTVDEVQDELRKLVLRALKR